LISPVIFPFDILYCRLFINWPIVFWRFSMKLFLPLFALTLLVSACASTSTGQNERLALYRNNAGAPVASFSYSSTNLQWRVLSDNSLVVWIQSDRANLVEFRNGCPNLRSAREISISNANKTVVAGVDSVRIISPLADRRSCKISTIRPLNMQAINDGKRDLREAQTVARDTTENAEQP
jgi:hypothetical protein